ncbi:thrombospondin type 1 domain protein [Necator americanus]|uniref:Thrombospondin type 1 domain protein n=1 Tax=Necator americanus TaxID=51031 RepID=W2TA52_NECAM|nr:thrombospondin type 1 domain protein [Necator americanus]ETN78905.1 thrombospondin type 1 domain protein [Necator americanus]
MFEVSDSYVLEENGIRIGMFSVGPPDIEIRVPQTHHMLHELNVQIVPKLCLAEKFTVNLLYRPIDVLPDERWIVIATSSVVFHMESVQITFPCENFTNAGLYRVDLVNSQGYEIQLFFSEEIDIPRGQSSLSIGCSQFDIFYVKYCFELVSVDLRSSVFHLWKSTCVNTEPEKGAEGIFKPKDSAYSSRQSAFTSSLESKWICSREEESTGNIPDIFRILGFIAYVLLSIKATWESWSAWSECSATCGESIQKRYRFCENPEPKRGVDCVGEMIETRTCVVPDCLTLIKSHGMLTNCSCGCALNGTSGSFFATVADAEKCGGNQTWYMSARTNSVVSDFSVAIDPNAAGKLFFFLRAPYEELVWFSGSNQEQAFTLRLDRPIFVVLWYKGNNSAIKGRKGFTISFSTREVTNQFPTRNAPSCQPLCPETVIIALLSLIFLFIICFPPFLCASLTRRLRTRNCHDRPLLDKIYDSEMIRSGNTEYTQASGEKPAAFTAQRSIGIQLSVQSTPRPTVNLKILSFTVSSHPDLIQNSSLTTRVSKIFFLPFPSGQGYFRCARTCVPSDSPQPHHGTSISTTDELEYDYYDGTTIPGSLLAPVDDLLMCEIEIDQIIAQSSLYSKPVETHDMYTQV